MTDTDALTLEPVTYCHLNRRSIAFKRALRPSELRNRKGGRTTRFTLFGETPIAAFRCGTLSSVVGGYSRQPIVPPAHPAQKIFLIHVDRNSPF
jgi:hypothetical protein